MKRFQQSVEMFRHAMLRHVASRAARISEWASAKLKEHGPLDFSAGEKRLRQSYAPWDVVLRQGVSQNVVRELLNCGALGHDFPRSVTTPAAKRTLVLAAHQDDETTGAGGTLIRLSQADADVQCVYYTDGATASGRLSPEEVQDIRKREAMQVWKSLGGRPPIFLDYPNRLDHIPEDAPARLAEIIADFEPEAIFLPLFLEQPIEHRRLNQVLRLAIADQPPRREIDVWGYQITSRAPGNAVVDITSVARRKYKLNRLWKSQNCAADYAYLSMGRDIANSYLLKRSGAAKSVRAQAEAFLQLPLNQYLELARLFFELPEHASGPEALAEPWNSSVEVAEDASPSVASPPDFFVVGMQKSGSYWLSALLDAHPDIRCFPSRPGGADGTGETHLFDLLARMHTKFRSGRKSLYAKQHGYFEGVLPEEQPETPGQWDALYDAVRLRFNAWCESQRHLFDKRLVGDKTTESVHHGDLIDRLYPGVKKICILRDPRDRVVSFFFHQQRKGRLDADASISAKFVSNYILRVEQDYRGLLDLSDPVHVLTYEALTADPAPQVARLLDFLEADHKSDTVDAMIQAASFSSLSGRSRGDADPGSHFRKGEVNAWADHLPADLAEQVIAGTADLTADVAARFELNLDRYLET